MKGKREEKTKRKEQKERQTEIMKQQRDQRNNK